MSRHPHGGLLQRTERDPRPLYHRIQLALLDRIQRAEWKPGQQIPAEPELARSFGVSRMTIRQALDLLVREGVLERRRGRGTFVPRVRLSQDLAGIYAMTRDMQDQGVQGRVQILSLQIAPATALLARICGLALGDRLNVLRRLVITDAAGPFAYIVSYIPVAVAPGLDRMDLSHENLGIVLAREYGVTIHHQYKVLEPVTLSRDHARILDARAGALGLRVQYRTIDRLLRLVEYRDMVLRGEMARYYIVTSPAGSDPAQLDDRVLGSGDLAPDFQLLERPR